MTLVYKFVHLPLMHSFEININTCHLEIVMLSDNVDVNQCYALCPSKQNSIMLGYCPGWYPLISCADAVVEIQKVVTD